MNIPNPIRVSFIQSGLPWKPYGALRVVYEYANQLAKRGHDVRVVHVRRLRDPNTHPVTGLRAWVRKLMRETRDTLFKPTAAWQPLHERVKLQFVERATDRSVPDGEAIFATAWDTVADVLSLPSSKGEKCYLIQSYDTWSGRQEKVDATWRAPLHKVVVAKWLYDTGRRLGCEDMVYIPNGVDQARFRVVTAIERRIRRIAARYAPEVIRGMPEAVTAMEIARRRYPDLQALFFGTPAAPNWIPNWIEYYRNPPQDELVQRIYNGSAIFLLSSWSESFSLPAAEAMACGCALVTTDCGGVREYATPDVNCLISPPKDPQALAANLLRLLDDDPLRVRFAHAGAEAIRQFNWEESGKRLAQFIAECVPRQSKLRGWEWIA